MTKCIPQREMCSDTDFSYSLPEAHENALETYYKILQFVPLLEDVVKDCSWKAELGNICSKVGLAPYMCIHSPFLGVQITGAIRSTRASDTNGLKMSIPQYASPNPNNATSLKPPIILSGGRAEMGLNHPILAQWLCPAEFLKKFDQNPEQYCK